MAIFRGTGGQGDSTTDTTVTTVTEKAAEAASSATSAATSASAASSSATAAANSAATINANIVNDTTPQLGGDLDGQANKITNIGDPTSAQDAATKTYVDSQVQSKDALSELSGDSDDITQGSTNLFLTTTERTKLSGIEASATADQTAAEIRTLVESATDSNVFTDADHSKLNGIEASATADQTDAEIKTAYENNSDTNAFTDAEQTKLSGIETGATADQTASEILTAIKTVDGSGSGLDADLLDGNEASAFATSAQGSTADSALQNVSEDTTPQLGGNLNTNNKTLRAPTSLQINVNTNNQVGLYGLSLPDADFISLGSDFDLRETSYFGTPYNAIDSGNDFYIGSPNVYIESGVPGGSSNKIAEFKSGAEVALYHNAVKKLQTASTGVDVTGNITVSGTVDGRDVAADGTKLDGIEASADVTDTANVTAAGALMDSEVTNLAQVKAFDSADYATAAQGATADSALQTSGGTLTGDLAFGDNVKATFGAGDDLQIFHNGSSSFISDASGAGFINIRSNAVRLASADGLEILSDFVQNGAVTLYHNNSAKLATTSSGVDVTGTLVSDGATIDGNATLQNSSGSVLLKLDGSTYPEIRMLEGDTTDVNSRITNNGGQLTFQTLAEGGTTTNRFQINHTSGDVKFYEDTGTTAKLTWDASAEELQFKDNVKAEFGDGGDLNIRHNGTDGIITNNTNDLQIINNADDKDVRILADNGSGGVTTYIRADGSTGEVQLSHYSSEKLATKSTGIDVTGTVTADGLTVDGSANAITLQSPSQNVRYKITDGTVEGRLGIDGGVDVYSGSVSAHPYRLRSNDTKRVEIASNGDISFYDDSGTSQDFYWDASTSRLGLGVTAPSYQLQLGGSSDNTLAFFRSTTDTAQIVIRDDDTLGYFGARNNFIYISPTSATGADGLVVRTDTGNVGIGTTTPQAPLDIKGTQNSVVAYIGGDSDNAPNRKLSITGSNNDLTYTLNSTGAGYGTFGQLAFATNNSEAMRIDSNGRLGIGTTSPSGTLSLDSTGSSQSVITTSGDGSSYVNLDIGGYAGTPSIKREVAFFTNVASAARTERMRIAADGKVGIGTTSPLSDIHIAKSAPIIRMEDTDTNAIAQILYNTAGGGLLLRSDVTQATGTTGSNIIFETDASEAMRIDSSGNLLVGKTSNDNAATAGIELEASGQLNVAVAHTFSRFNRLGSDGEIISFRKDGSTVGSIGAKGGDLYVGTGDIGLRFNDASNAIVPVNTETTAITDGLATLGGSTYRFKDLYLSGGVYLGGTGSANLLDDYEEGTWTPSFNGYSTGFTGRYTKIGNIIHCQIERTSSIPSSSITGSVTITGLPFVAQRSYTPLLGHIRGASSTKPFGIVRNSSIGLVTDSVFGSLSYYNETHANYDGSNLTQNGTTAVYIAWEFTYRQG